MSNEPRVSVIVPTCLRNDLLSRCLDRLAPGEQTLDSDLYEVIVTDDGMAGEAKDMVSLKYPWAQWVEGPHKGPAANRNSGASVAKSKWLAFTDDDCIPDKDWLGELLREADNGCEICEGMTFTDEPLQGLFYTAPVNKKGGCLWSCNFAIKTSLFSRLGGFDELFPSAHLEDVDFRMRAIRSGCSIQFVPKAKVLHPQRYSAPGPHRAAAHKSSVHLAYKHNLSMSACGLGFLPFVRRCLQAMRSPAHVGEKVRYVLFTCLEAATVAPLVPLWMLQYRVAARKGRQTSE